MSSEDSTSCDPVGESTEKQQEAGALMKDSESDGHVNVRRESQTTNASTIHRRSSSGAQQKEAEKDDATVENLFAHAMAIRARHIETLERSKLSKQRQDQMLQSSNNNNNNNTNKNDNENANLSMRRDLRRSDNLEMEDDDYDCTNDGNDDDDLWKRTRSSRGKQTSPIDVEQQYSTKGLSQRSHSGSPTSREGSGYGLDGLKYSYLRPEHLLRHEQAAHEERLKKKKERQRLEQIRLRNLAVARAREQYEKNKAYEEKMSHFSNAAILASREGPDTQPIHSLNVTTTRDPKLKHRLWFPSGRHGGRDSKHKPPLGYGALPTPAWSGGYGGSNTNSSLSHLRLNNMSYSSSRSGGGGHSAAGPSGDIGAYDDKRASAALEALGYDLSDDSRGGKEEGGASFSRRSDGSPLRSPSRGNSPQTPRRTSAPEAHSLSSPTSSTAAKSSGKGLRGSVQLLGSSSDSRIRRRRGDISPLKPFSEELFEEITKEKVKRREQMEHEEKWAHIRLIQQKRAESVQRIEEQKRKRQLEIEEQLKQDVVAAQADKDHKRALDQQFAFEMRNLDRARREKIAAYKEERAKAVLKNALEMRMEALKKAENQERFDRQVKTEQRTAADAQRTAHLIALQEERDRHEAQLAHEAKLRAEFEARNRAYNFQQEQERIAKRREKLSRVDRQIRDKLRYREHEAALINEKLNESEHLYKTLLKAKKPYVVESRSPSPNSAAKGGSQRGEEGRRTANSNSTTTARDEGARENENSTKVGLTTTRGGAATLLERAKAIDELIEKTDRENDNLRKFYRVKA